MEIKSAYHEAGHAVACIATGGQVVSLSLNANSTSHGRCRAMSAAGTEAIVACGGFAAMIRIGNYDITDEEFRSDFRKLEKQFGLPRHKLFEARQFRQAMQRAEAIITTHAAAVDSIGLELARRTSITGGRVHELFEEARQPASRKSPGDRFRTGNKKTVGPSFQSRSQFGEPQGSKPEFVFGSTGPAGLNCCHVTTT